jgi:very-short-patch-repair endonuclease
MDIQCPAPQNFQYVDDAGKRRFYIPDAYIESLNLIVEVKGELHNGYRSRDIEIERTKDAILGTSVYAYIKVEAQDYGDLMDAMAAAAMRADREAV